MAHVVPIKQVIPSTDRVEKRNILKMRDVLCRQGQIEPLQVQVYSTDMDGVNTYITFYEDVHANEIMMAARMLEWDTVLITVMNRYEQ